ncbi:MAG: hypothetical protein WAL40_12450 [Rhodoplanes sp.]
MQDPKPTDRRKPLATHAATNEYFEAEDALGRWLDECCERGAGHSETTAALYDAWKSWADASGEYAGSKKRFSENLTSRGFHSYRDRTARGFRGLHLREGSHSTDGMEFWRFGKLGVCSQGYATGEVVRMRPHCRASKPST